MSAFKYPFPLHYENDKLFSQHSLKRLKKSYMREDEHSPQERFAFVATQFASNEEHARRIYNYASNFWLSFSTPLLSFGRNKEALPISCYLTAIQDTSDSIMDRSTEFRTLSMLGGGVGVYFGMRPADNKSTGIMPHANTYNSDVIAWRQATTRRAAVAVYVDDTHPEVDEFIRVRDPFGGDPNRRALNIHNAINLSDDFMYRVLTLSTETNLTLERQRELDEWTLTHPAAPFDTKASVRTLWESMISMRIATGEPFMHFVDASNRNLPRFQRDLGLRVNHSNLCTEITLPTGIDYNGKNRTAVCCLSSINLAYYDDWKDDPNFVGDIVEFLDNVLTYFINASENHPRFSNALASAAYSAKMERAIGIGALGWHDLLQRRGLPFEGVTAQTLNNRIFSQIKAQASARTMDLAIERGACPDYINWRKKIKAENSPEEAEAILRDNPPVRNSHLLAIAPNASSSIILNTSPSIEPYRANIYREEGKAGVFIRRNPNLEKVLEGYGKNTDSVWDSIIENNGSVAHLDFLSENEKYVYRTFEEIDPRWIISHAADRQKYICQAQSLNLFFHPTSHIAVVSGVHVQAWKAGLKSIYYMRSDTAAKVPTLNTRLTRERIMSDLASEEGACLACEG